MIADFKLNKKNSLLLTLPIFVAVVFTLGSMAQNLAVGDIEEDSDLFCNPENIDNLKESGIYENVFDDSERPQQYIIPTEFLCDLSCITIEGDPVEIDNFITGTDGDDLIIGSDFSDDIEGNGGKDCILAGDGDDKINGGYGKDIIFGGSGHDRIYGKNGDDLIYGERGRDYISGGNGDDEIYGGRGDDKIFGKDGDDLIYCGGGDDTCYGDNNNDLIYGEDGDDMLYGGNNKDYLNGGDGHDRCYGESGTLNYSDYCESNEPNTSELIRNPEGQ